MSNVTKITLTNESIVNANGKKRNGNSKPIFCIDTGKVYASQLDAAEELSVHASTLCAALTGKTKTCKGMRFCFVSKLPEYFEEIAMAVQVRQSKIKAYDEMVGHQNEIAAAKAEVEKHRANYEKLQQKLTKEMEALTASKEKLARLESEV